MAKSIRLRKRRSKGCQIDPRYNLDLRVRLEIAVIQVRVNADILTGSEVIRQQIVEHVYKIYKAIEEIKVFDIKWRQTGEQVTSVSGEARL